MSIIEKLITWYCIGFFVAYCLLRIFYSTNRGTLEKSHYPVLEEIGERKISALASLFSWLMVTLLVAVYISLAVIFIQGWIFRNITLPLGLWGVRRKVNKILKSKNIKL